MKVGIAPTERDLNGVMNIGDALVAAQQEPSPDHGADVTQYDIDLISSDHHGAKHRN
jgi:hypothetical protein